MSLLCTNALATDMFLFALDPFRDPPEDPSGAQNAIVARGI